MAAAGLHQQDTPIDDFSDYEAGWALSTWGPGVPRERPKRMYPLGN